MTGNHTIHYAHFQYGFESFLFDSVLRQIIIKITCNLHADKKVKLIKITLSLSGKTQRNVDIDFWNAVYYIYNTSCIPDNIGQETHIKSNGKRCLGNNKCYMKSKKILAATETV